MLNASLRNRYKDVQRERDHQAATNTGLDRNHNNATRALEESQGKNDGLTLPSVVVTLEDNANIDPSGTVSPPKESTDNITTKKLAANSNTATPKKKKRSKKTPSKSSANNHRTQDEGEAGPYSSNNAALLQPSPRPTERYANLGGISSLLQQLRELIEYPLSHPELFLHLGVEPPRGVLLRGPPGCGKVSNVTRVAVDDEDDHLVTH